MDDAFDVFDRYCRAGPLGAGQTELVSGEAFQARIGNWVFIASWSFDPSDTPAVIADIKALARSRRKPALWRVYEGDRPTGLTRHLEAGGFTPASRETLLGRDLAAPIPASALPVRQVCNNADLDAFDAILGDAFADGHTPLSPERRAAILSCETVLSFVAMQGDQAISAGQMDMDAASPVILLRGGSTRHASRRQGGYSALLHHRLELARRAGKRWAFVEADPESRPILLEAGFQTIRSGQSWIFRPA